MPNTHRINNLVIYFIYVLGLLFASALHASAFKPSGVPKVLDQESAFNLELKQDNDQIQATWFIAPNCYLYEKRLKFSLVDSTGKTIELTPPIFPKSLTIDDPYFGKQEIYKYSLVIDMPLTDVLKTWESNQAILNVEYQGCAESGFCYPPTTKSYTLTIAGHHITNLSPKTTQDVAQNAALATVKNENESPLEDMSHLATIPQTPVGYLSSIGTFYLFGLLLTFTPCVWPMIPILAGIIVGQAHLNTRKAFRLSLCYVLSMAFTYAIGGIIAATLGKNLQASLQQPIVVVSFSLLFAILGFMQLGILKINLPRHLRLKDILHALHAKQESGTYIGAAIMGLLATLISSPCVTPALIFALGYISHSGNILLGGSALLALGLGMGTILLAIGTLGGKFLPRSGPWMQHVNQVFAIIMFGLSIWLLDRFYHQAWILILWGLLSLFIAWCLNTFKKNANLSARFGMLFVLLSLFMFWGAYKGFKEPLQLFAQFWGQSAEMTTDPFHTITTESELTDYLNLANKEKRPTLLVFYADWCVACQHLEHEVFSEKAVQEALKEWSLVRVDVTLFNAQAEHLLKKFDLIGPPAVLFLRPNASELTKYRIIGSVSEKSFLARLEQVEENE